MPTPTTQPDPPVPAEAVPAAPPADFPWRADDLYVDEANCLFGADRAKATICVRSSAASVQAARADLEAAAARNLATAYASSRGVADARVNGFCRPEPYNSHGTNLADVSQQQGRPVRPTDPLMRLDHYRLNVPVIRKLT